MKHLLTLTCLLFATHSFADDKAATTDEYLTSCATGLEHQLTCKEDFCAAMVKVRLEADPRFKGKAGDAKFEAELRGECLKEIAVDGAGDLSARKAKCDGWTKERGQPAVTKAELADVDACWAKKSCGEQISCWSPKMAAFMKKAKPEAAKPAPAKK